MMERTAKDDDLIALLKVNARESVVSLARKLSVSRSTVQDRLRRLEDAGIISGYTVRLAEDDARAGISAYIEISVEPHKTTQVVRSLLRFPQVETLQTVSGKFDLVAFVRTQSPARMDVLLDKIGLVDGITRTESAIVLSTKLDRR